MTEPAFHLQPGDLCRLLDGPLMLYVGIKESDEEPMHWFGYWEHSAAFSMNPNPNFVLLEMPLVVAQHAKKVTEPAA